MNTVHIISSRVYRVCTVKGRDVSLAGYLVDALDKQRIVDNGEKESWTQFFCRHFSIQYRPHGIKRTPGRPKRGG
jgi:hypothetical protein